MTKEKQIEEMAMDIPSKVAIERANTISELYYHEHRIAIATELYNAGYRKVDEDYAIQCTCYALGCQMAEKIKEKVITEFKAIVKQELIDKGLYLVAVKNALDKAEKEILKGE